MDRHDAREVFHCVVVWRLVLFAVVLSWLGQSGTASADDPWRFRRTTPRAVLTVAADTYAIGLPGGRAWGLESTLHRVPRRPTTLAVEIAVGDGAVREAFVRVAYYATLDRSAQIAIVDSAPVPFGEIRLVEVLLDPPDGAIAYRVRVLARLFDAEARSSDDAVIAGRLPLPDIAAGPSPTRLRGDDDARAR